MRRALVVLMGSVALILCSCHSRPTNNRPMFFCRLLMGSVDPSLLPPCVKKSFKWDGCTGDWHFSA